MRDGKRKGRGIDYNREVAFEKRPTAGFYDTGEEKEMTKEMGKEFRPVTLEEMEGKRRKVSIYNVIFVFGDMYGPRASWEGEPLAQWLTREIPNFKIAGSTPARLNFSPVLNGDDFFSFAGH